MSVVFKVHTQLISNIPVLRYALRSSNKLRNPCQSKLDSLKFLDFSLVMQVRVAVEELIRWNLPNIAPLQYVLSYPSKRDDMHDSNRARLRISIT